MKGDRLTLARMCALTDRFSGVVGASDDIHDHRIVMTDVSGDASGAALAYQREAGKGMEGGTNLRRLKYGSSSFTKQAERREPVK